MYMDVDVQAYPEGHTLWDKLVVPCSASTTLSDLSATLRSQHGLVLSQFAIQNADAVKVVYTKDPFNAAMKSTSEESLTKSVVQLVCDHTGVSAPTSKYWPLKGMSFVNTDDDECVTPIVVLHLQG